ncbi:MAG: FtsQ-type POTRA domain-containing protein [Candidatus Gracilibacteria bacterium]|nr:FtsQ-type POTRA domain-containing protein [Candidatus Gracilibacteria bacterium]
MFKQFLKQLKKKYKKLKNRDFHKKLENEKARLYGRGEQLDFNCRKNKFQIFSLSRKYINFVRYNNNKYIPYYFAIGAFLILGSIYIFFYSSYFAIQKIYIERTDELSNINIAYKAVSEYYGNSIILSDENEIKNKIISYQKNIKTVDVRKMLPDSIKISITSYKGAFNTQMFGRDYIVSNNGIFIPIKNSSKLKFATIHFKDPDTLGIIDYKDILSQDDITKTQTLLSKINGSLINIKIKDLDFFPIERELHVNDDNGTKYIFDLTRNLDEQVSKTKAFFDKNKDTMGAKIIYMDLRIIGKIFYCDESEKNSCYSNLKRIYNYNITN